LMSWWLSINWL